MHVAVFDDDDKTRHLLAVQLGDRHAVEAKSPDRVAEVVPAGQPFVAVFGPNTIDGVGVETIGKFGLEHREAGLVLVTHELTTELLQQAMRAGVREVVPVNATEQLAETVDRVIDSLAIQFPMTSTAVAAGGSGGRVITVFSTKGGSGKSVIASNLAVALQQQTEGSVALVDADLQFGDISVMLKLTPQHTIIDAALAVDRLDPSLLRSLMVEHKPSKVMVLPAPIDPAFSDQVSQQHMARIIEVLRESFDYVVIDTPAYFNDVVLSLIDTSDEVIMVGGMDVPNIKNIKIGLQTLRLLNLSMSKVRLVLNRANSKVKLEVGEVERTLQLKADCLIPSDIIVPQSVNKSTPAILDAPKSGVARAIEELAQRLIEAARAG